MSALNANFARVVVEMTIAAMLTFPPIIVPLALLQGACRDTNQLYRARL